jgi:hypothetical protein
MKRHVSILILILTLSNSVYATVSEGDTTKTKRWYKPAFVPIQFAGNIGFLSTGIGFTSHTEKYELALMYGYVPASLALTRIHTITAKNVFPLRRYDTKINQAIIPYLGLAVSVEVGGNAFLTLPEQYPKSYYDFPKSVHATAFGGVKLQQLFERHTRTLRGIELFAEVGTVDVYVWYKVMSEDIKLTQMFSLALGVNLMLPE